jgi:hypothetical protein
MSFKVGNEMVIWGKRHLAWKVKMLKHYSTIAMMLYTSSLMENVTRRKRLMPRARPCVGGEVQRIHSLMASKAGEGLKRR